MTLETETSLATAADTQLRYSASSLRLIERFLDEVGKTVKRYATLQAQIDGRDLINANDVIAAIDNLFKEFEGDKDAR